MDNSPADSSNNTQAPSQPPVNENIEKPSEQPAQDIPTPEPVKAAIPPAPLTNPIISTAQSYVNPVNTNSNSGYNFKIILPILIILIIVFFGIFYIINSSSEKKNTLSQVPKTTNTVTTLPTPSPQPQQVTPTISSPASNEQLDTEIQTLDSEITNLDSNITNIDNGINDKQTNLN